MSMPEISGPDAQPLGQELLSDIGTARALNLADTIIAAVDAQQDLQGMGTGVIQAAADAAYDRYWDLRTSNARAGLAEDTLEGQAALAAQRRTRRVYELLDRMLPSDQQGSSITRAAQREGEI